MLYCVYCICLDHCNLVTNTTSGNEDGYLGKIGEFQPSVEDWMQYAERLEFFFAANGITTAEKKRATFLAVVLVTNTTMTIQ